MAKLSLSDSPHKLAWNIIHLCVCACVCTDLLVCVNVRRCYVWINASVCLQLQTYVFVQICTNTYVCVSAKARLLVGVCAGRADLVIS